jgi:putative Holliday junction resolvase
MLGLKSVGVDYGIVRTGIAVTVGYNPKPLETIVVKPELQERKIEDDDKEVKSKIDDNRNATFLGNKTYVSEQVVNIARREQADQIIVGLPLHSNGTEAEQTIITRLFAAELALHVLKGLGPDVPVYLWDERYTSKEAAARAHSRDPHRYLYGTLDAESASIILEHYYNDNGEGAERVTLDDETIVKEYSLKWEEMKQKEEEQFLMEQIQREERLRWRKEAMERDRIMEEEFVADTEGTNQKKKKKRKKKK